ncbi:hypothetical protein Q31b_54760 [Novipirellula aureliae]|uniref:Uncharacterized protein n=1 Tax=Novipirellula aureliae TaxID=2527966 RepID=A0A5C6DF39_9BACT|nr:hypothetical protein Q31b_54760 [Novipirellula aureliae]
MGKRLSEELGREKEYDTLSKWIANLLAEKIVVCETASDGEEKERLQQQAVDLTLRIWHERYCVPPCIRPFEKVEKAISYLADQSDRETDPIMAFRSRRQDSNPFSRLSDAFEAMRDKAVPLLALTQIVLVAGSAPLAWEEENKEFLDQLESDAVTLVRRWLSIVDDTSESESDWTSVKNLSPEERVSSVVARLEEGLDQIRQTLDEFKAEIANDLDQTQNP